jgi:hypothetical protein
MCDLHSPPTLDHVCLIFVYFGVRIIFFIKFYCTPKLFFKNNNFFKNIFLVFGFYGK